MQNDLTDVRRDNAILSNIVKDMTVYDSEDNHMGDIDAVHFGEGHDSVAAEKQEREGTPDIILEIIGELFNGRDDLPEELRERLLQHGFATVNNVAITRTYFFTPEDVHRVEGDAVYLNKPKDEIIYN